MNRRPYDPPAAPVAEPSGDHTPARWKWLLVSPGHAALLFVTMIALRQLWALPYEGFSASRLFDVEAARAIFAEALFQGGVQLLMTVAVLWALPRILVRHAVYIAVASVIFRFVVSSVEAQLLGPMQTNGEHLQSVAATYVVVLVVCSIIVRRKLPVAPKIAGST